MAYAICSGCATVVRWRAGRGARLADLRCPKCGSELHGKTEGRPGANKGRHYRPCDYCGRRRLELVETTQPWLMLNGRTLPAGSRVCGWHDVEVPDPAYGGGVRFESVRRVERLAREPKQE